MSPADPINPTLECHAVCDLLRMLSTNRWPGPDSCGARVAHAAGKDQ